jgi:hypothetical protein
VSEGEGVYVDVSAVRPNGRVDRAQSGKVPAVINATTTAPDVIMPATTVNRPPTITGPTKLEIEEGVTRDEKILVTDPDINQTVQIKVEGAPFATVVRAALAASTAYSLHLAPGFAQAGQYMLKLTATDSEGATDTHEIALTVKNANRAPTASDQSVTLDEDSSLAIKLEATDLDGDRLGYMIVSQPQNGKLSGNAPNVTYTPNLNFAGADRFSFRVSDGDKDSNVATVSIKVRPINDPPSMAAPEPQTVNEGQPLNLAITASDPDAGQKLTFSATGLPDGATLARTTATSAQFRWTPTYAQAGTYSISLKVDDDASPSLSDTKVLRITVTDVPLFTAPTNMRVIEGQSLSFDVAATSGMPLPVTFSVNDAPSGVALQNPQINGFQFRWTPNFTQAGAYLMNIKATMGGQPPVSEVRQVLITVLDAKHDFAEDPADLTVIGNPGASSSPKGGGLGSGMAVGDLDGDGIDDMAVGAPSDNGAGQVYIFLGRAGYTGTIDLAKKSADVTIKGEAPGDQFGSRLTIGDVNADGKADLVIGAPLADASPNAPDTGKVYAVFGKLSPGVYDIAKVANFTALGAAVGDHLGASVAIAKIGGAANPATLLVGAPLADVSGKESSLPDAGAVYGFFGGAALTGLKNLASSSSDFSVVGVVANGQFGSTLATGNFDGDDLADVAVGAPSADFGALKAPGIVYLIPGAAPLKGVVVASGVAAWTANGTDSGDAAGSSLAMGDVNGDGRADLIIGAPGADGPNNSRPNSGEVYVIFGAEDISDSLSRLTIFGGAAGNNEFPGAMGTSLAVGDFTGDGIVDLIVGAPGSDAVSSTRQSAGAAYVIFGGSNFGLTNVDLSSKAPDLKIFGAKPGDHLGAGGFAFGKLDLMGANDLAIGIPGASKADNASSGAGEARVLRGVIR